MKSVSRQLERQDDSTSRGLKQLISRVKRHWSVNGHVKEREGFDWFVGIMFLFFEGDEERTWDFLKEFGAVKNAQYTWPVFSMVSFSTVFR